MTSQHEHGYAYDIFVSYSSRDGDWVERFVKDLVKDANRFAEPDICHFLDEHRLQPGYVWDAGLIASAQDSALIVPVLSPRFLGSDYCQKEVNAFLSAFGGISMAAHRSRVLPVKLLCEAPKEHVLSAFQVTPFCHERADELPMEFPHHSPEYGEAIRKLAVSIGKLLKAVPRKGQNRLAVYLAAPRNQKLRDSLAHTYEVLPQDPQALLTAAQPELALDADFEQAFMSIHTLTDAPMVQPLIDAQLAAARKHAKPRLIFGPDEPPAGLLHDGFEWMATQSDLEDHIRRLAEKRAERVSGMREPLIYFLCPDRANKTSANSLLTHLEAKGIRVYPSPLEGPGEQALQTHVQALDELDGCLIYYGNIDRNWFDAVFFRIAKKIRQRGLPSAVFVAPPPNDHKTEDLPNIGVPLLKDAEAVVRLFRPASAMGTAAP